MDALLTTLIGAAPQLGGAGILLLIIGLLLRREAQDRADYRAELTRVNTAHDEELAELRAEIDRLRGRLAEMETALDEERRQRRAAEDRRMAPGRHQEQPWR